jgi:peptidoglycan/xylan/chitin deacetylase (PgdA/CDA1 family)
MTADRRAEGHGASFSWPDGADAALGVTFDLDAESAVLAVDVAFASRPSVMSHQAYGPRTGLPRLLRLLAEHEIRATFFVPGFTAERHPGAVEAILADDHEIAHHGYLHRPPSSLSPDEERAEIERGLEALDRLGVRPVGFRAPWWDSSPRTLDLLSEFGFAYDASLFDQDLPYVIETASGSIVEIPESWALDDWEKYAFLPDPPTGSGVIEAPSRVADNWWEEITAYHTDGACCVLVMHPFLSGRPARAWALGTLLDRALELPGLWIATMREIADHCASLGMEPVPQAPPPLGDA